MNAAEKRVVELLRELRTTDRAPASLRARIEAARPSRAARGRNRVVYGGGFATALAGVVLALVLILPAGTPGAPSVSQAAALALRPPTAPAPAVNPSDPSKLGANVQDLYFANWPGWKAVGQRFDRLAGRPTMSVYYRWHGDGPLIVYTIVGAPALATPPAALVTSADGTEYRTVRVDGRQIVTWHEDNHTCVLSGVSTQILRRLAEVA